MEPAPLKDRVSVVIPTRGRRWSLLDSIGSAVTQPEAAEVIVVYNGGLGNREILEACRERHDVVLVERDDLSGCGPARQVGVCQRRSKADPFSSVEN